MTSVLKSYLDDIEVYDPCDTCFDISELEIECPQVADDPYIVPFKITICHNSALLPGPASSIHPPSWI